MQGTGRDGPGQWKQTRREGIKKYVVVDWIWESFTFGKLSKGVVIFFFKEASQRIICFHLYKCTYISKRPERIQATREFPRPKKEACDLARKKELSLLKFYASYTFALFTIFFLYKESTPLYLT